MRTVWIVLGKDLLRRLRSPLAPIVYILFPFVFSGLIALAFGGGDQAPRFRVALVNQDEGLVARLVMGAFNQEQVSRYFEATEHSLEEAERLIEKQKVSGALVVPAGFSEAVLAGREAELRVIKNPAEAIGPVAIEQMAATMARLLDGALTVLSGPLAHVRALDAAARENRAEGWFPSDETVVALALQTNEAILSVRRFALPPLIRLERVSADTTRSAEGGAAQGPSGFDVIFREVLPGMAAFALLILALGFMADIPREKSAGTLARQLVAPVHASAVLAGKVLSVIVAGLLTTAVMALIAALLLDVHADPLAFVLLSVLFLFGATGFLAVLFGITRTEQQGGTLASIVLMAMSLLGGSWIPLDAMPGFVLRIAPLTLNYWAIQGYRALLVDGAGVTAIGRPLIVFLLIGVLGILIGGWGLHRRTTQGA